MSKNSESFSPSQPISINTNKTKFNNAFGSWSPASNSVLNNSKYGIFSTSPPPNLDPLSPTSPQSSMSSLGSPGDTISPSKKFTRRMSLNIGASSLTSSFFKVGSVQLNPDPNINQVTEEKERPPVRRTRTLSNSERNTASLAEKWGFGVRDPVSQKQEYSQTMPANVRKTRADFLRESSSKNRSNSPMRDMMLKGHFDM